jgi:putative transposase
MFRTSCLSSRKASSAVQLHLSIGDRQRIDAAPAGVWRATRTGALSLPRLKGHRSPRESIAQAVRLYLRFNLSLRHVKELLAERGVVVFCEEIVADVGGVEAYPRRTGADARLGRGLAPNGCTRAMLSSTPRRWRTARIRPCRPDSST